MVKFGLQEPKRSGTISSRAVSSKNTTIPSSAATLPGKTTDNIYENPTAAADHTYSGGAEYANLDNEKHEFPAKSDDNANIWVI